MTTIGEGIAIGAGGGFTAGLLLWLLHYVREKTNECRHKKRLFDWLKKHTAPENDKKYEFMTTRAIASANNLTQDRVRYICSIDDRIKLSTGKKDDVWKLRNN